MSNIRIATPATPEMARQFRIACAIAGRRQSEVLRELIQQWIDSQREGAKGWTR